MDCRNDGGKRKTTRIEFSQCIHPASFSKSLPEQIRLLFFARHIGTEAQVRWQRERERERRVGRRERFPRHLGFVQEIILSRSSEVGPGARDAAIKSTTNCFRAANFAAVKLPSCINHPALHFDSLSKFRLQSFVHRTFFVPVERRKERKRERERVGKMLCSFSPRFMILTIS